MSHGPMAMESEAEATATAAKTVPALPLVRREA
jgi:hypothetical protein